MEMLYGILFIYGGICFGGMSILSVISTGGFNGFSFICGIIAIPFLYIGIKKTYRNIATKIKGLEKYGIVVDSRKFHSDGRSGIVSYCVVTVMLILDDGNVGKYKEVILLDCNVGTFLKIKHYKNDINILGKVDADEIDDSERMKLESYYNEYLKNKDNK